MDEWVGLSDFLAQIDGFSEKIDHFKAIEELLEDSIDPELSEEAGKILAEMEGLLTEWQYRFYFSDPEDKNNAIITLHSGAGGTEACDWVSMLFRMYSKWAAKMNFRVETVDFLPGEEAGLKRVTALVSGKWASGYLEG